MMKSLGVTIPNSKPSNHVPSLTVTNIAEARLFVIAYGDEYGKEHVTVALKVGDKVYELPNGEATAAQMIGFTPAITKQIIEKVALRDNPEGNLPKTDKVKVL